MHFKFYRQYFGVIGKPEIIGEDQVYHDFIRMWDREETIKNIYELKIGIYIHTDDAQYWAEEVK